MCRNKNTNIILTATTFLVTSSYAEDPWTPSPLCPYPSEEQTRFPYEGDCSKYWECYEGARYPMDCPAGLEFSTDESKCDDPTVANCDPDATIIYPTFSHSTVSTQSTVPTADPGPLPECPFPFEELVFFPVVNNCSQYWECFRGNRYLMSCQSGLYWNTEHNYCDYPSNVDCSINNSTTTSAGGITTTTTTAAVRPWTLDPQCPYPSDKLTFFPHPTNCSQYYECYEGNKFLMSCPSELVWNDVNHTCDYRENIKCNRNSTTSASSTANSPTDPTNPTCAGAPDGTYLPHLTDCRKFYKCVGERMSETMCQGNLLWNQKALTCDHPVNVNCSSN